MVEHGTHKPAVGSSILPPATKNYMSLVAKFENSIHQESLICSGNSVLVACSGGPDSVALFHLFLSIQKSMRLKLALLHFNHGLRGRASKQDESFVVKMAKQSRIPIYVGRSNVRKASKQNKTSLEEAAREARYRFFLETAKRVKMSKIVLGHTIEDQAETVLMRILQGTGLKGLCGIRKTLKIKGVFFHRPLLDLSKKDILTYLKKEKIKYCLDQTNHSTQFLRNRIRKKLVPILQKEYNPRTIEALARIPSIVSEEIEVLEALEAAAWKRCSQKPKHGRKPQIQLDRTVFLKFPAPLQFRVLEKALKSLDSRSGLSFQAWKTLQSGLKQKRYRHSLPRDIDIALTQLTMKVYKK